MAIVAAFAVPHPPLIIPAVGRGREKEIQKTIDAYREVGARIAELDPQTIVISSPHSVMYRDYIHVSPGASAEGNFGQFGAREARYAARYDTEFVTALAAAADADELAAGCEGERDSALDHATMIPLHFIQEAYRKAGCEPRYKVVRMGISGLSPADHYRMGTLVQRVASVLGRRCVYVASGDLSHKLAPEGPYGFAAEGPKFDRRVCNDLSTADFLDLLMIDRGFAELAAECGLRSFQIMAGALDQTDVRSELLSYQGPFGVGYGVAAFVPTGEERADPARDFLSAYEDAHREEMRRRKQAEDPLVRLARLSLETFVRTGERLRTADVPDGLLAQLRKAADDSPAGCFVSLKKGGELRGCIGTIMPTRDTLWAEILGNAVSAGAHDPRFSPVRKGELDELVYDVDVLTPPERIAGPQELDVHRYGVIVSTDDGRRGLLLPDLDGVDSVEQQVRIAAHKGGIDLSRDDWHLDRFEVVRHT